MKYLLIILVALCGFTGISDAQIVKRFEERNGQPILEKDYTDVVGSPYLSSKWSNGTVKFVNGSTMKDVPLKYNIMEDALYFKEKDKEEPYIFGDPVEEFMITYIDGEDTFTKRFRKGYKDINKATAESYFEILSDGTIQLIKRTTMGVVMSQEWNSATKVKNFKDESKYYLVTGGKATQVKNDKKAIIDAIPDKKQQLQDYIKANKISKSDADLGKIVTYYNSL